MFNCTDLECILLLLLLSRTVRYFECFLKCLRLPGKPDLAQPGLQ